MGGQRVDDHSSWVGKGGQAGPLPLGCKVKSMEAGDGAGKLNRYEDSPEEIKRAQDKAKSQANKHKTKENYRY